MLREAHACTCWPEGSTSQAHGCTRSRPFSARALCFRGADLKHALQRVGHSDLPLLSL